MASSPTGSATPFSDYTSSRSNRGLGDIDVLDVYILKHGADPVLVLLPVSRIGTYAEFLSVIKNDLHPGLADDKDAVTPLIYTMDPYMTISLLRPTLWPDLIPYLRGKRLLVLPGDSPAPTTPAAAATEEKHKRSQTSWTQYLTPKSAPTTPETTRISVDASPARAHTLPALPALPPPAPAPAPPTPDAARTTAPEVFYTPETIRTAAAPEPVPAPAPTNARRTKAPSQLPTAAGGGHPRGFRPLTRTESFLKPPEFGFDISLWCRFAPAYKPGLLMHVQFREITLQVVPSQPGGLDVGAVMNKAASAITNMVRRQGFLRMTSSFRELAVRPGALRMALEDWPSVGGLVVGVETLRWVAEPVVLFCEVGDVEFVREGGGREDPRRLGEARREEGRRDEARREEGRRDEARREEGSRDEARREEGSRDEARREEGSRDEARREPKPMPIPKKGRKVKRVQVESEDEVD
ncbi:uncharacterized protein H6S33_001861 [Morchella sextelata]|uniref:uncharacterized protein n=1 Tax=Morchella sextelata TaxID=1174677 RepID=UPI001D039730|nr:uncharacterized protein H6S33_001861 [Morchella sextelata]KAH0608727.1 hypothetical protein H6S33_001861 [Morchella sextelata]